MNGIGLYDVQEIASISITKAGGYSRDFKWLESISELEKAYFCAWLLSDEEGLQTCEFLIARACFEAGSLSSSLRFINILL